jgi:V/A-type H+-transporting ATPase subunit I
MIVRLKRITLVSLASERDATLAALREAGIVHVTDVHEPFGAGLDEARTQVVRARTALESLERARQLDEADAGAARGRRRKTPPQIADEGATTVAAEADDASSLKPDDAPELVLRVEALAARRADLEGRAEALTRELERVRGLGEFDPAVLRELASGGVSVRLAQTAPDATLVAPDGYVLRELSRDKHALAAAVVADRPFELEEIDLGAECVEIRPPERSPAELRSERNDALREATQLESQLRELSTAIPAVRDHVVTLEDAERFAAVRAGMGVAQKVVFLQGYVPVESVPTVRHLAARHGWGVQMTDPAPGEDVPTMLRYSRFVAPVRAVLDFLKIYPGYWEADVGWTFLIFFSLFFAMLAGDAGYGALLLIAATVVRLRAGRVPRYAVHLLFIVGTTTLIWGILTGNYFGIPDLPAFMTALKVDWLTDRDNIIQLCFLIGAVHLTIAHVWNIGTLLRGGTRGKAVAQFGYLLVVWSMFFLARQTVLGLGMPSFVLYMLAVGFLLVAVFMATPQEVKQSFIGHALLPLNMISNFVDILSYIRLFAVGYASIAVIAAFNQMASSIGFDNPIKAVGAALLILFANALNLILIGLGVLVHAVRLNTLEFSTHKGLTWAGHTLYSPFASRRSEAS